MMNAKPIQRELTDDDYEDALNELYGTVDVCGMTMDSGAILRELDPIAFNCGKSDYENSLEPDEWACGVCDTIFNNEDEADECCQEQEEE